MLDDVQQIKDLDKSDALGVAAKELEQFDRQYELDFTPSDEIENVVLSGMGGSALSAEIIKSWPAESVPFEIVKIYKLPKYVNSNTLYIASSFSGNTEETLDVLSQAEEAGAQIIIISAGGKLTEIAKEKNYPMLQLDSSLPQPRMATFDSLNALTVALETAGVVSAGSVAELKQAAVSIKPSIENWKPDVPRESNLAKQIALKIKDKSMVIYSGPLLKPAAYKWKISFNENAKNIAWTNFYPEIDHNEVSGWLRAPSDKPYSVIDLQSSFEHPRVLKRFKVTNDMLGHNQPDPVIVEAEGDSLVEHLLWTIVLGDYVSLYTALLNGIDPSPVDFQEKFKRALNN